MVWIKIKMSALLIAALLFSSAASAQSWSEWFSQKKTQRNYLLEQLAALKVYSEYLKKGYEISRSGLTFIKNATKGEFELHSTFFSSLKAVNPEVGRYAKVAEIIRIQTGISKTLAQLGKINGLGEENRKYLLLVKSNLAGCCLDDLEELLLIITSGKLEMGDDERLERIDQLYEASRQKESFALSFLSTAASLADQRMRELETIKKMEEWYERN